MVNCQLFLNQLFDSVPVLELCQLRNIAGVEVFDRLDSRVEPIIRCSLKHLSKVLVLLNELKLYLALFERRCRLCAAKATWHEIEMKACELTLNGK